MKITPQDIRNHEFKRSLRGYDMDEVDAFLEQIAAELEALVADTAELKDRVKELNLRVEEYKKNDDLVKETLLAARQASEQIKEATRKEAEAASKSARDEAAKMIEKARAEYLEIGQKSKDLKRYYYDLIIQYKALLDRHYRLLSEMVAEAKAERDKEPAPAEKIEARAVPADKGRAAPAGEGERTPKKAETPAGEFITLEISDVAREEKEKNEETGERVKVVGKPDGTFDAERAADEVFRRLSGVEEEEPIE